MENNMEIKNGNKQYEILRAFYNLPVGEVKVLDRLIRTPRMNLNLSSFAKELGNNISNQKKTLMAMEKRGVIQITYDMDNNRIYKPIRSICLRDDWLQQIIVHEAKQNKTLQMACN